MVSYPIHSPPIKNEGTKEIELMVNLRNVNSLFDQTLQFIKNVPDKILRSLSVPLL